MGRFEWFLRAGGFVSGLSAVFIFLGILPVHRLRETENGLKSSAGRFFWGGVSGVLLGALPPLAFGWALGTPFSSKLRAEIGQGFGWGIFALPSLFVLLALSAPFWSAMRRKPARKAPPARHRKGAVKESVRKKRRLRKGVPTPPKT